MFVYNSTSSAVTTIVIIMDYTNISEGSRDEYIKTNTRKVRGIKYKTYYVIT